MTMDEKHMQFILATGFNKFWRGARQKERMCVDFMVISTVCSITQFREAFLGKGIFNRDGDVSDSLHDLESDTKELPV